VTIRGNKRDAQQELRRLLGQIDRGEIADAGKLTLGAWLEQWLAETRHTIAPKTHQERSAYVRLHITPRLGRILLAKLVPAQIQAAYTDLLTGGRRKLSKSGQRSSPGLAPQTVRHIDRVLHVALGRARRLKLITTNPVDDADPPRVERAPMVTLKPEQQAALLAAAEGTDLYLPTLLLLSTGMRRGELLGLSWLHIDLDAGLIHILQVIEETKAGARVKPQPKTAQGRRSITLPAVAVEALRRHRIIQAEEHLRHGLGRPDLLFGWWSARPAVFGTAFSRMAARVGVEASVHDLRHTHITDLLATGTHPKVVSERAGHSSVAFTLQRYGHVVPGMQEAAARQVDEALRRVLGGQSVGNSSDGGN
jgi:integrase